MFESGLPQMVRLSRLNTSNRNSSRVLCKPNVRAIEMFSLRNHGPRSLGLRTFALPNSAISTPALYPCSCATVSTGVRLNSVESHQRSTSGSKLSPRVGARQPVSSSTVSRLPPPKSGRPYPGSTDNGKPDAYDCTPDTRQPPTTFDSKPSFRYGLFAPKGSS